MFYDKRMGAEVDADSLGDEWKGYVVKITGGNDKQGFPMKQGVLTNGMLFIIFLRSYVRVKFIFSVLNVLVHPQMNMLSVCLWVDGFKISLACKMPSSILMLCQNESFGGVSLTVYLCFHVETNLYKQAFLF